MNVTYPFTEEEAARASAEWGCNCGPTALAFALQMPLDPIRRAIPDFERKRYTSPTMMKAALATLGTTYNSVEPVSVEAMFEPNRMALVRVQWTGRWTEPGANPKWAYGYTHWIACWSHVAGWQSVPAVFDCNGGVMCFAEWAEEIVPLLATHKGGDGKWVPTHIWRLPKASRVSLAAGGSKPDTRDGLEGAE